MPAAPRPSSPQSSLTLFGGDLRRQMCGAWFVASPGPGGRIFNHAPNATALTQSSAVRDALYNNPFLGTFRLQQDTVTFENTATAPETSGAFIDLGDPIATTDDVTVLVGWIPQSTAAPSTFGNMFVRGQDGSGSGWSILMGHNGTNQVQFATVLGGAQQTATGASAGLIPGQLNYVCGSVRQASSVRVACNGRLLTTTATGNSNLRTSGKGCRVGTDHAVNQTSKHDPVAFVVLWRRALNDAEMAFITAYPWILWSQEDYSADMTFFLASQTLPIEWKGIVTGSDTLPIEWSGNLYAPIPVEWTLGLASSSSLPVEWNRRLAHGETLPIESTGTGDLGLRWNVIQPLGATLLLMWDVLVFNSIFTMQLQWNVVQALAGLTLRWNDIPDVFTPFGVDPVTGQAIPQSPAAPGGSFTDDIQRPVAVTDRSA